MNSSQAADRGVASAALAALLWAALCDRPPGRCLRAPPHRHRPLRAGEDWDGLGILIGSVLAVPALVVSGLAWVALRGARRRSGGGRGIAVVLGVLLVVPILFAPGMPLLLLPVVVGVGLVGVAVLGGRSEGRP